MLSWICSRNPPKKIEHLPFLDSSIPQLLWISYSKSQPNHRQTAIRLCQVDHVVRHLRRVVGWQPGQGSSQVLQP